MVGPGSQVIDVHTHVVPPAIYEAAASGRQWHGIDFGLTSEGKLSWRVGGTDFVLPWVHPGQRPDERVAVLDALGVDVHVVSLSPTMWTWYELDSRRVTGMARAVNTAIAGLVAEHPRRLRGLAFLPMQDPAAAVAELEFAVSELGLIGAAVGTHVRGDDWDDAALFPVLEAAAAAGAMLFIHPASGRFPPPGARYHLRNVVGNPLETTMAAASLIFGGVLDRLPELRVVLAHGGGYACAGLGRMDHAYRARREAAGIADLPSNYARHLYWDSLTHSHAALRYLIDVVGQEQVMLGTDYPADMSQDDPVRWLHQAPGLTDVERAAILGGNASGLIGPPPRGVPGASTSMAPSTSREE